MPLGGAGRLGAPGRLGSPGTPPPLPGRLGRRGGAGGPPPPGRLGRRGGAGRPPPPGRLGAPGRLGRPGAPEGPMMQILTPLLDAVIEPPPAGELTLPLPVADTGAPLAGKPGVLTQCELGRDVGIDRSDAAPATAGPAPENTPAALRAAAANPAAPPPNPTIRVRRIVPLCARVAGGPATACHREKRPGGRRLAVEMSAADGNVPSAPRRAEMMLGSGRRRLLGHAAE